MRWEEPREKEIGWSMGSYTTFSYSGLIEVVNTLSFISLRAADQVVTWPEMTSLLMLNACRGNPIDMFVKN